MGKPIENDETRYASAYLGDLVVRQIDRPLGSRHPQHSFIYPINYGFVPPNTPAPDGDDLDAYVLGVLSR
jgi:inorganic pyrophosphatase